LLFSEWLLDRDVQNLQNINISMSEYRYLYIDSGVCVR